MLYGCPQRSACSSGVVEREEPHPRSNRDSAGPRPGMRRNNHCLDALDLRLRAEHLLQSHAELRSVIDHCLPDDVETYSEVLVRKDVAHRADPPPVDPGKRSHGFVGDAARSLAGYYEIIQHGVSGSASSRERRSIAASDVALDRVDALQHVLDPQAPFSRRHGRPRRRCARAAAGGHRSA